MKTLINQFIEIAILHTKQLKLEPENYKENNKIAEKLNLICEKIEKNDTFPLDYLYLLRDYPNLGGIIGIRLRNYDLRFSKQIYHHWYNSSSNENWQGKFVLPDWQLYQVDPEKK